MNKHNQDGAVSAVAVSLVFSIILLIAALAFGGWAFSSRQDYKNNVDTKVKAAASDAVLQESKVKDAQFAQDEKQPLRTYNGPAAYGSIQVSYPKTWSAYVDDTGSGGGPVDAFFDPLVIPALANDASVFALRFQVLNQTYSQTLQNYSGQIQQGTLTSTAYALPLLPKTVGVEISGLIQGNTPKNETIIILPLRSQTIKIWTEGNLYLSDFNTNILPHFSFSP